MIIRSVVGFVMEGVIQMAEVLLEELIVLRSGNFCGVRSMLSCSLCSLLSISLAHRKRNIEVKIHHTHETRHGGVWGNES